MPDIVARKNKPASYKRAQELRQRSSLCEQKMWLALRSIFKTHGFKFRRQRPIDPYIVDFACLSLKLVIELDGTSHDYQQVYDRKRDNYLRGLGYEVMHIPNEEILRNLEGALTMVLLRCRELKGKLCASGENPSPNLDAFASSPKGRGTPPLSI